MTMLLQRATTITSNDEPQQPAAELLWPRTTSANQSALVLCNQTLGACVPCPPGFASNATIHNKLLDGNPRPYDIIGKVCTPMRVCTNWCQGGRERARGCGTRPPDNRPSWGCSADGLAPGIEPCVLQLRAALQPLTERCAAVHLAVSFYPGEKGRRKTPLPKLHHHLKEAAAGCHVALVDSAWSAAHNAASGWHVEKVSQLCFGGNAPRTAHFVKTAAPLLVPHAQQVFAGDAKCTDFGGFWPVAALNCSLLPPPDLVAIQHPEFQTLTLLEGLTREVTRVTSRRDTDGILDLQRTRQAYEAQHLELERPREHPDTFCMKWEGTAAAREYACRWSQSLLSPFSMREQASFRHSQPRDLSLHWIAWKQLKTYYRPQVRAHLEAACAQEPVARFPDCGRSMSPPPPPGRRPSISVPGLPGGGDGKSLAEKVDAMSKQIEMLVKSQEAMMAKIGQSG